MLTAVPLRLELPRLLECIPYVFGGQNNANSCLPHLLPHVHQRLATASTTTCGQPMTAALRVPNTAVSHRNYCKGCMSLSLFLSLADVCLDTALALISVLRCSRLHPRTLYSPSILHSFLPIALPHHSYLTYLLRCLSRVLIFIHRSEVLRLCSGTTLVHQFSGESGLPMVKSIHFGVQEVVGSGCRADCLDVAISPLPL